MGRVYYDEKGIPFPYPVGRENGKKARSAFYVGDPCPICGKPTHYTFNGECRQCSLVRASDFYAFMVGGMTFEYNTDDGYTWTRNGKDPRLNLDKVVPDDLEEQFEALAKTLTDYGPFVPVSPREAARNGSPYWLRPDPCPKAGHIGLRLLNGDCYLCQIPTPRKAAKAAGESTYLPTEPCPNCGKLAPRMTHNNKCTGCRTSSPRQGAIRKGLKWYAPTEPCIHCGQIALRRVNNGACQGCMAEAPQTDQRETPSSILMREQPDLIMTKEQARSLGYMVYRTGRPCNRGHNGFRYVSTGTCVDCLRGR